LGLNVSSQSGALIYQSLTWTPIEFNLFNPIQTFFYVGVMQLVLVLAHFFYTQSRLLFAIKGWFSSSVVKPLGLFSHPPSNMLWSMGFIGVMSIWFSATNNIEYGDAGGKFVVAFIPFAYGPYLIPFFERLSNSASRCRNIYTKQLIAYTLLVIIVALVKNSRGIFALAFMTVLLAFFLYWVIGSLSFTKRQLVNATLLFIPALLVFSILSDLADAMVIARVTRGEVKGLEFIEATLIALFDRESLAAYKQSALFSLSNQYNEIYISNPIVARLVTVKFDDNMLHFYKELPDGAAAELLTVTIGKFIALLPTPIINLFGLGINKTDLEFSIGDFIWYLFSGVGLGGYRTGSIIAHGLILFEWWFFVLILMLSPLLYAILDGFSYLHNKRIYFSPVILFASFTLFTLFNGDGLNNIASILLRALPQLIVLYFVLMLPFRKFNKQGSAH